MGEFKEAMAHMACPVSIATGFDGDRPHGTTVSAIMSVSMDPELFMISLNRESDLLGFVERTGRFGVNILSDDQTELALTFAMKGDDKFDSVSWSSSEGLPRIEGACTWLACSVERTTVDGDHVVLVGAVEDAWVDGGRMPLVYQGRRFSESVPITSTVKAVVSGR